MTDTQREFEAKFPLPAGVTLFGKEYVWFGGNHHGKTCESYNDMWKAFQAGIGANAVQLQSIYDDMYRHKDIAQVAQKLFMLINGKTALSQQQDNAKPDVYDIAVDTGDGTYWTAEVVHFQQNDNVRKIQVRIPQQGAQLLQQGEAVAYIIEDSKGEWITNFDGDIEIAKKFNHKITPLFTTPPDTQQKLDKAREALRFYAAKQHMSLDGCENGRVAQQALKETE